jgi:WD40 repeat protein
MTQLIAHDREVYDVAWLPQSTDIFVSVGADGSLRAFDLRSLEHSTILYETPAPKNVPPPTASPSASARPPTSPLLRIAFNPADSNYMSTFHMDGNEIQILDMRSPGQPVMELRAHAAPVNGLAWGSGEQPLLATCSTSCLVGYLPYRLMNDLVSIKAMIVKSSYGTSPTTPKDQHLHGAQVPGSILRAQMQRRRLSQIHSWLIPQAVRSQPWLGLQ